MEDPSYTLKRLGIPEATTEQYAAEEGSTTLYANLGGAACAMRKRRRFWPFGKRLVAQSVAQKRRSDRAH